MTERKVEKTGPRRGEEHGQAKLDAAKVALIRETTDKSDYALAKELGVERSTVRLVRLNQTWHDPHYTPRASPSNRGRKPRGAAT